ncbi:GDSL-type esterase/lipase family protein [Paenibacillus sp. GCM10012307]|uniref:GDSL family lipase n=1 Tax=Paenibacillus roseus TaxID=2798579 RepID=A0A934J659_9BACL|nr:GDSL-type esterase/lipase family protein [Paenibacillus roseus]MBJ6363600.1 GDSL family lipase [Paenibacillus roseus]
MNKRSRGGAILWRTIASAAVLASLLLLFGFAYAVSDILRPPALVLGTEPPLAGQQPQLGAKEELKIVAIGDSLTKGTGDATGEGYVRRVVAGLSQKLGNRVKLVNNVAINGLRTDQLIDKLQQDAGMQYALKQADLILFTIGGNDLSKLAQTALRTDSGTADFGAEEIGNQLSDGLGRLDQVFQLVNRANPDARVVYVGLYNPFYPIPELRSGSLQVQKWNDKAYELSFSYPNMKLVPIFDLFEDEAGTYLASDRFHPNSEGYAHIAERIVQMLH